MIYKVLIVDDEPLVQIGLKSILSQGISQVEVTGTASNGEDALDQIGRLQPDIVIADIRMPLMSGLELLKESRRKYGAVPVFIMLTAYEEFEMARQALSGQAVDYLVKIELTKELLNHSLEKAIVRLDEVRPKKEREDNGTSTLEDLQQKFMVRLLNGQLQNREGLINQAKELNLDFHYDRYVAAYGKIDGGNTSGNAFVLYTSCLNMTREIVRRYLPCHVVSNDLQHFTLIFLFEASRAMADMMTLIQEAVDNTRDMVDRYFNVSLYFGIGVAVTDPMDIPDAFKEAVAAQEHADDNSPVRLFSHIVGANRRSGKDRLIASIQDYINENLGGKLQLNEVAEVFGLSPAYLSVIFKKNTEIGFSEYVYTQKIEKAKEMLLSGDMKIYEVADALGFESAFYFSKVFKKVDGKSPREYIQSKEGQGD